MVTEPSFYSTADVNILCPCWPRCAPPEPAQSQPELWGRGGGDLWVSPHGVREKETCSRGPNIQMGD